MIKLERIGHVYLSVANQDVSERFYRDVLGFRVAEKDPEHGGVFMTLGDNFHTLDIGEVPNPEVTRDPATAGNPDRGRIGMGHLAFQVGSYEAFRDAYIHLQAHNVPIKVALNHVNQRSLYFADPDGNTLEIYYEVPYALELFPNGREDTDERLPLSKPGEPLPDWLREDWPSPALKARIAQVARRKTEPVVG
jgi:catechol 2,3-dioxygenase